MESLAKTMVAKATPENEQLLSFLDLTKVEPENWVFQRPLAVYIVFAEGADVGSEMRKIAQKIKSWLASSAGLDATRIALCDSALSYRARNISDATAEDCAITMRETDCVLFLQTQQAIEEPRCLARLYTASKFGVPIVPVCLNGLDSKQQYNFDTTKPRLLGELRCLPAPM